MIERRVQAAVMVEEARFGYADKVTAFIDILQSYLDQHGKECLLCIDSSEDDGLEVTIQYMRPENDYKKKIRLAAAKRQRKSRQKAKEKKAQLAVDQIRCDEEWERKMLATLKVKYE